MSAPDIYAHRDYREYLRAYYQHRKRGRAFSYRVFSRRAGLKSPNYLKLVIDGERNLSASMAGRFARACELDAPGVRYFEALVAFNQARTIDARNRAYTKLKRLRRFHHIHPLAKPLELYHSKWYYPAIRELVLARDFRRDPAWIAARLSPPVTPEEAEEALSTLLAAGLLCETQDGRLEPSEVSVSTGPEVHSMYMASFHCAMMDHAKGSIDRTPRHQRDISSLTLCLAPGGIERVKLAVQRFRRELLELSELEDDPRQVVQMNFQLFPLSTLEPGEPHAEADASGRDAELSARTTTEGEA